MAVCLALSNEDLGQNIVYYVLIFDGLLNKAKIYPQNECCVREEMVEM